MNDADLVVRLRPETSAFAQARRPAPPAAASSRRRWWQPCDSCAEERSQETWLGVVRGTSLRADRERLGQTLAVTSSSHQARRLPAPGRSAGCTIVTGRRSSDESAVRGSDTQFAETPVAGSNDRAQPAEQVGPPSTPPHGLPSHGRATPQSLPTSAARVCSGDDACGADENAGSSPERNLTTRSASSSCTGRRLGPALAETDVHRVDADTCSA